MITIQNIYIPKPTRESKPGYRAGLSYAPTGYPLSSVKSSLYINRVTNSIGGEAAIEWASGSQLRAGKDGREMAKGDPQ